MKFSSALKLNHIFRRLYATSGQASSCMVLYARKNRLGKNRVGITVGKKLGGAVVRNRVRRRLREVYRLNEDKLTPGWDIVLVARSRCISADFQKLEQTFLSLAERAGITETQQCWLLSAFIGVTSLPLPLPAVGLHPLALNTRKRRSKSMGPQRAAGLQ